MPFSDRSIQFYISKLELWSWDGKDLNVRHFVCGLFFSKILSCGSGGFHTHINTLTHTYTHTLSHTHTHTHILTHTHTHTNSHSQTHTSLPLHALFTVRLQKIARFQQSIRSPVNEIFALLGCYPPYTAS